MIDLWVNRKSTFEVFEFKSIVSLADGFLIISKAELRLNYSALEGNFLFLKSNEF